ncbi:MAG: biotin/lipoyl-binding protein [Candidatus Sumerlaeota bacterium]|nr:biotin/lipoyl-binding protein [Candidatus Sumerlaeota bacterium]
MTRHWIATVSLLALAFAAMQAFADEPERSEAKPTPPAAPALPTPTPPILPQLPPPPPNPPQPGLSQAENSEREEGTLYPGQSVSFHDVTLTWKVPSEDAVSSPSLGLLDFRGPTQAIPDVPVLGFLRILQPVTRGGKSLSDRQGYAYLDGVCFILESKDQGPNYDPLRLSSNSRLSYCVVSQPAQITLSAAPWLPREFRFVSAVQPIQLGLMRISLSERPVPYPGGASYYELKAADAATGAQAAIPATSGSSRKVGRFTIRVLEFSEPTRTASLGVSAEADKTARGADAYVDIKGSKPTYATLGEFLDLCAKEAGFEVEWREYPDRPESVEYVRDYVPGTTWTMSSGVAREKIDKELGDWASDRRGDPLRQVAWEWKDPTHLRVWAKNYDQVLAQMEKQEQEKKAQEEDHQRLKDLFAKEYTAATDVFPVKTITPETAKDLAAPELRSYRLLSNSAVSQYKIPVTEQGGFSSIVSIDDSTVLDSVRRIRKGDTNEETIEHQTAADALKESTIAETHEQAIADDKAGALIVTAIPRTQKKIAQILGRMEETLEEETRAPAKRYRIEAILLEGGKAGELAEKEAEGYQMAPAGVIKEVAVKAGDKVKPGDVIARFERAGLESLLKGMEIELAGAESALKTREEALAREELRVQTELSPPQNPDLLKAKEALEEAKTRVQSLSSKLEEARQKSIEPLLARSVMTITDVAVKVGQEVAEDQRIVSYIPEGASSATFDPSLAERCGITKDDMKMFGFDGVVERGKALLSVLGEKGEAGKALAALSDNYQCSLEFLDARTPYLVVKGRLLDAKAKDGGALMDSTVYLEKDKPSVLGLTNLRQALILVLRLRDEP